MGIGVIQPWHLLLILAIVLIVFGAGKLGSVGSALGQSVKEFKSAVDDGKGDQNAAQATPAQPVAQAASPAPAQPVQAAPLAQEAPLAPVAAPARPVEQRPVEALRREEI